jgi:NAD-dependent SIR2 family protein deacetylase
VITKRYKANYLILSMASVNSGNKAPTSPKLVLLLGAGASKEFDLPLFSEIEKPFLENNQQHKRRVNKMYRELNKVGFSKDIENYISYARGQLNPIETVRMMNPFASYYVSRMMHPLISYAICRARTKNIGKDLSAEQFLEDIQDYIHDKYIITELFIKEKILSHYDGFFDFLKKKYFPNELFQIDIFTTNYDDSLEFYSEERGLDYYDGFMETSDGLSYFDHTLFSLHDIRLYKLHGSVRIGMVKDDQNNTAFISTTSRIPIGDIYKDNWKLDQRMMLLGHEKDLSQEPYFEMLNIMKEKLMAAQICIAIGYSFSNSPVLNIVKDVLRHKEMNLEFIILNKFATQIKNNKFSQFSGIKTVDGTFGEFNKI